MTLVHKRQYEAAIAAQQPIAEFHSRTFPTFKAITVVDRDDSWVGTKVDGEDYHCYKRHWEIKFISDQQVWNGEGLPPVGSKVESFINGEWKLVKVAYTGEPGGEYEALVFDVKTTKPAWSDLFRPLRTEADRKREEAIDALLSLGIFTRPVAGKTVDAIAAGKIPGVEITK